MFITIVFNIKFPEYLSCKCCLNRFYFFDITNLIWHSFTDVVFKNWTYVREIVEEVEIQSMKFAISDCMLL